MRIQRYIFWELLLNFLFVVLAIGFASVLGAAVNASYRAKGASLLLTLSLMPTMLANIVPYLIPLSLLIAVVVTYGRISAERELTAIRMAGMHLWRILSPALILASVLAMACFWLLASWTPYFHQLQGELLSRAANQMISSASAGGNEIFIPPDGDRKDSYFMSWSHRGEDGVFHNVFVSRRAGDEVFEGRAREALMTPVQRPGQEPQLVFVLRDFRSMRQIAGEKGVQVRFKETSFRIEFGKLSRIRESDATLSELYDHLEHTRRMIAAGPQPGTEERWEYHEKRLSRLRMEIHSREALALTNLIFVLIGVPIAVLLRRSNRLVAFGVAAGVVLVGYYPLTFLGQALGQRRELDPLLAAHGPGILLAALGAWLLYRLFRI